MMTLTVGGIVESPASSIAPARWCGDMANVRGMHRLGGFLAMTCALTERARVWQLVFGFCWWHPVQRVLQASASERAFGDVEAALVSLVLPGVVQRWLVDSTNPHQCPEEVAVGEPLPCVVAPNPATAIRCMYFF